MLGTSFIATADTTPQDAFEYRVSVMTALRGHIGAVSKVVRGLVEDNGHLVKHAQAMADGAAEIAHVFPEGSQVSDSDALPVVWEEAEKFAAAVDAAKMATAAFVDIAASGDQQAIGAGFRDVGMSCRGCHDDFRVPQE
jgi:cytochrome c556